MQGRLSPRDVLWTWESPHADGRSEGEFVYVAPELRALSELVQAGAGRGRQPADVADRFAASLAATFGFERFAIFRYHAESDTAELLAFRGAPRPPVEVLALEDAPLL